MINVNCTFFRPPIGCNHGAAPRTLFGTPPVCILIYPDSDPRVIGGCALCACHTKPEAAPPAPPPRKP